MTDIITNSFSSAYNAFTSSLERLNINPSTLSGAIDIIVVKHPRGSLPRRITENGETNADIAEDAQFLFVSTPFHVRFGKVQVLRSHDVHVSIEINDKPVDLAMKLGAAGEAFFAVPTKVCILIFVFIISVFFIQICKCFDYPCTS